MAFPPDLTDDMRLPSGKQEIDFSTQHPLFNDLCPDDSYTPDGRYWVSLHCQLLAMLFMLTPRPTFHSVNVRNG